LFRHAGGEVHRELAGRIINPGKGGVVRGRKVHGHGGVGVAGAAQRDGGHAAAFADGIGGVRKCDRRRAAADLGRDPDAPGQQRRERAEQSFEPRLELPFHNQSKVGKRSGRSRQASPPWRSLRPFARVRARARLRANA
jgi:hypothetical protein